MPGKPTKAQSDAATRKTELEPAHAPVKNRKITSMDQRQGLEGCLIYENFISNNNKYKIKKMDLFLKDPRMLNIVKDVTLR